MQSLAKAMRLLMTARGVVCAKLYSLPSLWGSAVIDLLRRNQYTRRIWWRCHIHFPKLIPPTHPRNLERAQERDQRENEETASPIGEEVMALCVWGIEIYGPAEIEVFYTALERLRWNEGRSIDQLGCGEWIKQLRQSGKDGTFNIGLVLKHGERRYLPQDHFADLPDGVDYLLVKVHQICASLTCVQIAFVLDETQQKVYADALNEKHATTNESIAKHVGAYSQVSPYHHKERVIKRTRENIQAIPDIWFRKNMPGSFCALSDGLGVTTAELITSQHTHVLQGFEENKTSYLAWHRLLTNQSFYDLWGSQDCPGIRLSSLRSERDHPHTLISLNLSELPEEKTKDYGGACTSACMSLVNDQLEGVLIYRASIELLQAFRRSLMMTRDQLNTVHPGKRRLLKSLDFVQGFFSSSMLVPSIAAELLAKAEAKYSYEHECSGFIELFPWHGSTPAQLNEAFCSHTKHVSTRLLSDDKTTREGLIQVAEILTARESVKAQKRMEYLTVAAIGVALVTLWVALPSNWSWSDKLEDAGSKLRGIIGAVDRSKA